ncbi:MAG TPA: trypsin-like serine protease [Azospirillaceae bacterium]|nr:trypsin-like serine protease [Azospirillaceae bacterium]
MAFRPFAAVASIVFLAFVPPSAPAAEPERPPVPRAAVGVVEMADRAICSGVVVAPDVVLTAAHCLFDEDDQPARVRRFRAGVEKGHARAEAKVVDHFIPEGFDPRRFMDTDEIDSLDWAFLRLDRSIGEATGVLPVRVLSEDEFDRLKPGGGWSFAQVGYGHGDGRNPAVLTGCRIVEWWDDQTYAHDCGTVAGDSGSPNLLLEDGVYKVIGIESAEADLNRVEGADMVVASGAFAGALAHYLRR